MAKLIDAKEMEAQIKEVFEKNNPFLMGQLLRWVRVQTTIDAVPVVRCKDCKHHHHICPAGFLDRKADDFCSYGERREGE